MCALSGRSLAWVDVGGIGINVFAHFIGIRRVVAAWFGAGFVNLMLVFLSARSGRSLA